uniref:Menorin-like domain-containing protein n=1 Tax=Timema poppense TaxID=170557 RepID=A0A7R9GYK5_TIMPO|nr:unnamed protein product [Timema poppensis]
MSILHISQHLWRTHIASILFCIIMMNAEANRIMPNVQEYFPDIKGDLTKVTWAHAVNNKELFKKALADKLMMLEADVVLGNKIGSTEEIPIMAHPPSTTSELSLEDFLSNAITANSCGVKLDFKSIEVLEPSLKILQNHKDNLTFPVWLNADILSGPVNSTAQPVDADKFLSICARDFPLATLSPGWKVRYGAPNITSGRYEPEHITSMKEALARNNITQPVTFPVQAILAAQSIDTLPDLLKMSSINDTTLTIWLSEVEAINITQLKKLIDIVGKNRVYLDLPESIMDQLSSSTPRVAPTTSMGLVVGVVLVAAASYFF